MSVQIFDVLTEAIDRTLARNGLVFVLAFYVLSAVQTLTVPAVPGAEIDVSPNIGGPVVGGLTATLASLVALYVMIVALRTFVTDETETIPDAALREQPVWAFLNVIVGLVVFAILVSVGFVFLIVPGLFLLVTLWFFDVYVAVENDDFVTGLRRSWSLTSGNRFALFGLGVGVVLISIAITVPFSLVDAIIGGVAGLLFSQLGGAFVAVYIYATTAVAFTQLRGSQPPGGEPHAADGWDSPTDDRQDSSGVA